MRVLTRLTLPLSVILVMTTALTATPTAAHPPPDPDHGINATTFHTLWARDTDRATSDSTRQLAIRELANGTDIPHDHPPPAVEHWNTGDHHDFPSTDSETSIHPPGAALIDGRFIKDAYLAIFAIQPSTIARLSPGSHPVYVTPDGSVLGTIDYRIALPADNTAGERRVTWSLQEHRISNVRLEVDGHTEATGAGTHTPAIDYHAIDDYPGERHTLTLIADIEVQFERHERTRHHECRTENNTTTCWSWWTDEYTYPTDSVTVHDSRSVVEYALTIGGFHANYPNGDQGILLYKNRPWLGYTLPDGRVHGVWRFYTARDRAWDTLVTSTATGATEHHSPLHPLHVTAYPFKPGPTAAPRDTVEILETYGDKTNSPTLPQTVHLDAMTDPYTASYGLVTRTETDDPALTGLTAFGLVRGARVDVTEASLAEIPLNKTDLTVTIQDRTPDTVTVHVTLRDVTTDDPVSTTSREGYVLLNGDRVNTTADGTVTKTLPRPAGGVTARFVPGRWWFAHTGYVGDADVVYVHGTVIHTLSTLYQIAVPVSLYLLGIFIIAKVTGWRVWPPWRRL